MSMYPQSIVSGTLETKINLFSMKYAELPTLMSSAMQSNEVQCNGMQCRTVQCSAVQFSAVLVYIEV